MEEGEKLNWYTLLDGSHSFRGMRARKGGKILLTYEEAERLGGRVKMDTDNKTTETVKPTYEPTTAPIEPSSNSNPNLTPVNPNVNSDPVKSTQPTTNTSRDWSNTQDMKATDVVELINETDSKEELISLQEVEEKGQNRIGVMNAIKKRMGQIG